MLYQPVVLIVRQVFFKEKLSTAKQERESKKKIWITEMLKKKQSTESNMKIIESKLKETQKGYKKIS